MSEVIEHPEYNRDTNPYPSFGKKYNGEKAIISLTSWEKRIATCPKTIFSLIQQCPGFHIVLVLSEEEFPKMCEELPENLMLFVENEMIELLWVYRNYRSFKKILFTMDKYRDVPVISADDDCIYTCNYAQELYDKWLTDKKSIFVYPHNKFNARRKTFSETCGAYTIFPVNFHFNFLDKIDFIRLTNTTCLDDSFYGFAASKLGIIIKNGYYNNFHSICVFHDSVNPLSAQESYKHKDKILNAKLDKIWTI